VDAFGAEAGRLSEQVLGADETAFARGSRCPPWSVGELLYHVRIGVGRLPGMLAELEPANGPLISAAGYFRPGERFSPAVNDERIAAARVVAELLLPAGTIARLLDESGWDQVTLIAKATGRLPLTLADAAMIERHNLRRLRLA